jgi:LytS/YehU family sensor histidine kinase
VVDVEEAAAQCLVPPMVLQTLVENAVKYGVGQARGPGELRILAAVEGERLHLKVENNGTLQTSGPEAIRLGVHNIRERLSLLYRDRASFQLDGDSGWVRATVSIPVVP